MIHLLILFVASASWAYLENVVHGYQNCRACHISPNGGDLLTDYGRSLSRELMSTWGWRNSEQALFGALPENEKFRAGGDFRAIQTAIENRRMRRGEFFLMQQNLELAYRLGNTWLVSTFGTQEGPGTAQDKGRFLSERHYALIEPSELTTMRVGKYRIQYGLNDSNHTRFIKSELGFGSLSETYNLEVGFSGEKHELFLTSGLGRLDEPRTESERSISAFYGYSLGGQSKVGANALLGEGTSQRRFLGGIWAILAPWPKTLLITELDFERAHRAANSKKATERAAGLVKIAQSVHRGISTYLVYEHLQADLKDPKTVVTSPGIGVQWLPFPHFEVQAEIQNRVHAARPDQGTEIGWILLHFYI